MLRRTIEVAAAVALACSSLGCGCNEAGCGSGYGLMVTQEGGLERGLYEIDVALDGFTAYTCEVDLTGVPDRTTPCEGFRNAYVEVTALSGDFFFTIIGEGPDELPDFAEVTVKRDGAVVVMASAAFAYSKVYPNGKSCGSPCSNGGASISVPVED